MNNFSLKFKQVFHAIESFFIQLTTGRVAGIHFGLAAVLFLPFFLSGQIILGSTDNYYHHFPNMVIAARNFKAGELGLWNPYIFNGINFTASAHNFIYYPINWLIFLFSEKYFFTIMTIRMIIETWLVGVFGYLFFREELKDNQWALFSSIAYQLGGYLFFSITTYSNLTTYLLTTMAVYFMYTFYRRPFWKSFIYLVAVYSFLFLCGNIVYAMAALALILVIFLYRWRVTCLEKKPVWPFVGIFVLSLVTSLLVTMIRLLPFFYSMFAGDRLGTIGMHTVKGAVYLALTVFLPELMGVQFYDSAPLIYSITELNRHSQFHVVNYFGVFPILLVIWAFIFLRSKGLRFWKWFLALTVLFFIDFSPVSEVIIVALYPFTHPIISKMMIPLPMCVVAGHAGKYLSEHPVDFQKSSKQLWMTIVIVLLATSCALYAHTFRQSLLPFKIFMLSLPAAVFLFLALKRYRPLWVRTAFEMLPLVGAGGALFVLFELFNRLNQSLYCLGLFYASISIIFVCGLWIWMAAHLQGEAGFKKRIGRDIFIVIIAFSVLRILFFHLFLEGVIKGGVFVLAGWGAVRFILCAVFFVFVINCVNQKKLASKNIFLIFCFVLLADLIPHNAVYQHISTTPFLKQKSPYPSMDNFTQQINVKDYRVNLPHIFAGLSRIVLDSNIPAIYGIRSYGGVNSDVTQRHRRLLQTFGSQVDTVGGNAALRNERYLALAGTYYDIDNNLQHFIRPSAMSRFMFFTDFEVLYSQEEILNRLKDSKFDPLETVILENVPFTSENRIRSQAQKIRYQTITNSRVKVEVESNVPGILFFGDSYHKDWHAYINGVQTPVIRTNYNFMSAVVPSGKNTVVFEFRPKAFLIGRNITVFGFILFAGAIGWLYGRKD